MANTSTCLLSTIKNVSGIALAAPWWPPHGRDFTVDEEASVTGDILSLLQHGKSTKVLDAFVTLLTTNKITIKRRPAPVLYDATADRVAVLDQVNNALFMRDPCWTATNFSSAVNF